ncbi:MULTISPECIES: YggS family pyridoxal phosphate-dependent enzyme [Mammaliicoccus]|uniref:Pyridoxal phosphate homeostasis protein n=1 Tax=Mammaliicoccus sciuri TaxID=1296 RepID=A0ABT7HUR7_MAMSC|nr:MULTISPECIES: YggS family pyridoxal phosphate-dependent enzyme [Mammaliicoccus]MCE4979849.1 YggS family pyridoxal phosphate-dependent enzyme [Mammaliicoccus sciuri]MCE5040290.1 YggS family pyridoxal phosphate-dependent enzyme [Mammaliicoccus sciuri]MCE5057173.1 YggS family pyridoxal phosphate-dependent enzyme [Mammaliicoccus sciuri]MCE5085163.1 YggS family pyridoxal phosphate-dependent enzyme [Mammaliicoccus sciuri]MCE5094218.1 YggS family pyridoxal phosphate-dependent enzyme [Mammaliicoccu
MKSVKENLVEINSQICNSSEESEFNTAPQVIVVTKYVTIDRAKEAYEAGLKNFGENRIEGFLEKKKHLPDDAIMHFIGSLQTRKVKDIINEIDYLHALDRLKLAKEIEKRAEHVVKCFVQVNVSGEESKHGMSPDEVIPFIRELKDFKHIEIVGLMTMAPLTEDKIKLRQYFNQLRLLKEKVQSLNLSYAPCTELSMGMSNDFNEAILEGASYVRIGTKLVGE